MGRVECPCQDVDEVLGRFASRRRDAVLRYREFVAAGVSQGRREELRGGGLLRSEGGWEALAGRREEERVAADARVLGTGEFVEALWRKEEGVQAIRPRRSVTDLLREVSEKRGVEADAPISALAWARGRTCVAVCKAVEQARAERAADGNRDM
jgi:hypothetical protein